MTTVDAARVSTMGDARRPRGWSGSGLGGRPGPTLGGAEKAMGRSNESRGCPTHRPTVRRCLEGGGAETVLAVDPPRPFPPTAVGAMEAEVDGRHPQITSCQVDLARSEIQGR